jgi:RNA polymerase sigma-70 factor (ECF subfamily)
MADVGAPGSDDETRFVAMLYREYSRPLLAVVSRLNGGDRQRAEDSVQEVLVRAWRNRDKLDPTAPLLPWLVTVARRLVIDEQRARAARPPEVGDEPLASVPTGDRIDALLRSVVVGDALDALSSSHREILIETFFRDRTVNQAADVLGIPAGTAKSRVYYALRALRVVLEERGVSA